MKPKPILDQFKTLFPTMCAIYIPAFLLLISLQIIRWRTNIPVGYFTRDPAALMKVPFYIGFLSHIGALLWCSSSAICIFTYALLRKKSKNKLKMRFFLYSGLISLVFLLDDLFLLHEEIAPKYLHIRERFVFIIYAILIVIYLTKFISIINKTRFVLLGSAFAFFGLSIIFDIIQGYFNIYMPGQYLIEDGAKFLGILSWVTYFIGECFEEAAAEKEAKI